MILIKFKCILITNKDLDRISNQKSPNKLFAVIKKSTPNPFNPTSMDIKRKFSHEKLSFCWI